MLSVVIINKDRLNYLKVKLQCLFYQLNFDQLNILVVDYTESDEIKNYCNSVNVGCIRVNKPFNRSHARNVGIKYTADKWICICGNDTIIKKDFFSKLCYLIKKAEGYNEQPKLIFWGTLLHAPQEWANKILIENIKLEDIYDDFFAACYGTEENLKQMCLKAWNCGFQTFTRDCAYTINGYDEGFVGWGGEDDDFVNRAGQKGYKTISTKLPFFHLPHETMWDEHKQKPEYQRNLERLHQNLNNPFTQEHWGEI